VGGLAGLSLQAGLSRPEPVRVVPAGQLPVSPGDVRLGGLPGDAKHVVADLRAAVQTLHQRGGRRQAARGHQEHREPQPGPRGAGGASGASGASAAALRGGSHPDPLLPTLHRSPGGPVARC